MTLDRNRRVTDPEIWLLDAFGRFLDHDPVSDRLIATSPHNTGGDPPGLIFRLRPDCRERPFSLEKRRSAPMPLPEVAAALGSGGPTITLQILDTDGPYSGKSGFLSSSPDGAITYGHVPNPDWTKFAPLPAAAGRALFSVGRVTLTDEGGERLGDIAVESDFRVRLADRVYPLERVSTLLAALGSVAEGEAVTLLLPRYGDYDERAFSVSRNA
ncbi:hypothetical protein [Acetobacter sp. DsW_063]|uniref:hypothetical protein n=1 Tax=Acetobacter sp. DsW_063 TaxID=1514894 RepID=UPI000A3A23A9|nr:hypothetical protein [Acetobacter sp. DsW_063]OUJ15406.1 hypothetical protein HK28_07705 [Acetobacter sp. DsW_063]